jgi:hypothetical protein
MGKDELVLLFLAIGIILFVAMTYRTFKDRPNRPFSDVP